MKKKAAVLFALILLVLVVMQLPWAYLDSNTHYSKELNYYETIYYPQAFAYSNFAVGHVCTFYSSLLALLALLFAPFSGKRAWCRYLCSLLLFSSAAAGLYAGFFVNFRYFTWLTWCILAALTALGLWALFGFRRKSRTQDAQEAVEAEN